MTDDELGQAPVIDLSPQYRGRDPAIAQHGDPVGDVKDLAEVMGDEQHAVPVGPQAANGVEQAAHVVRRQRRSGLVEDQQQAPVPGIGERTGNGDGAALGQAERADRGPGIGLDAYLAEVTGDLLGRSAPADPAAQPDRVRAAEHHVVEDAQLQHQREILVHEAQACRPRGVSAAELEGRPSSSASAPASGW